MPAYPQFTTAPFYGVAQVTTLSNQRDGVPTSGVTLATAGTTPATGINGVRIDKIKVANSAADATVVTACVVRLWLVLDSGPTWRLLDEIAIASATPTTAVVGGTAERDYTNLVIPTGYSLRVSVDAANSTGMSWNIHAFGGIY
jgi:hypothetical protein